MEALAKVTFMEAFEEVSKNSEELFSTETFMEASVKAFVKVISMESFVKAFVEVSPGKLLQKLSWELLWKLLQCKLS